MNHFYNLLKFSVFILLLVASFILTTQNNLYAQSGSCSSVPAPTCTGSQVSECSGCGGANPFCCPLGGCAATAEDACNNTTCIASQVCKVADRCTEPATVPDCTGNDATKCSGCADGQFCCPMGSTGSCGNSFDMACDFSTCEASQICQVPEPPPPPPVRQTRNLTFINNCSESVWVGCSGQGLTGEATGFELKKDGMAGNTKTVTVPGDLQSGNFWPRTSCAFPCTSVPCCETGDCANSENMTVECNGGTKAPPANSFEVTFNESPDNDFYDITNVDGYAVGIAVQQMNGVKLNQNPTINGHPAPQLNCGNPVCTNFDMSTCPPELSETTTSGRQICWGLGGAANSSAQRNRDTSGFLSGIAAVCDNLALVGAACGAIDTGSTSCGTTSKDGCADSSSLYCCSPYNDNLPAGHGGIGCADATDPNYVNACSGVWPTPDASWCTTANIPSGFCTYNGIFSNQCPNAYSWQFNDSNSTYQCINPDYQVTFCPASANTDQDGVLDSEDTDSDNDGITNAAEGQGTNSKQNLLEIPADPDNDGIPNELDLDSDGDGIPDHNEGGGTNDKDSDGIADNFIDIDGDGHHDQHDEDQMNDRLPLPDTDGDGIPDFLDTDSDNDGKTDANETGSIDMDGDGILDNPEDRNRDGLADSNHPATGAPAEFSDTDNDGIFDHLDADDQNNGCSLAETGSSKVDILWLLVPVALLLGRTRRKK